MIPIFSSLVGIYLSCLLGWCIANKAFSVKVFKERTPLIIAFILMAIRIVTFLVFNI